MSLLVRTLRRTKASALAAGFGVIAFGLIAFGAAPAGAQQSSSHLGAGSAPVVLAQQIHAQRQSQRTPAKPASRVSEIAGRYAILRDEGKDTLCMVTLFETARGRGLYRAQLAPACRDNGVVIFDPIAWSMNSKGQLLLQARKGHRMSLERDDDGVWRRTGDPRARPLALRRI